MSKFCQKCCQNVKSLDPCPRCVKLRRQYKSQYKLTEHNVDIYLERYYKLIQSQYKNDQIEYIQKITKTNDGISIERYITNNLRTRLACVLKGNKKYFHMCDILGCSTEKLRKHLEKQFQPGMT